MSLIPRGLLVGAMFVAMQAPPIMAADATPACRVRNATQDVGGLRFESAVAMAQDGDRILVRGICHSTTVIDKDLRVIGVGEGATLQGDRKGRVIRVRPRANVTIRNLLLRRGRAPSFDQTLGGGVYNRGTLRLIDSRVRRNHGAYSGGGIYNAGRLTLIRSRVTLNGGDFPIQGFGGGIYNTGTATLIASIVANNSTDYDGAGIRNDGTMTLRRSTVSGNESNHGAPGSRGPGSGGIVNRGRLTLILSVVSGNRGANGAGIGSTGYAILIESSVSGNSGWGRGGGIYNGHGRLVLRRSSSVHDNTVTEPGGGRGGGIHNRGTLVVRNSSITANKAEVSGGGIRNAASGTVALHGASTVSGNTPDDCRGTLAC